MGMNLILIWGRSPCSHPLSLAVRFLADGSSSKEELPIAAPIGVYGCVLMNAACGRICWGE